MSPGTNLRLQAAALLVALLVRFRWGGVETVFFVITAVGPLLMLVPTALALFLLRRAPLPWQVWVPFAGMVAGMVVTSLFFGVYDEHEVKAIPVFELLSLPGSPAEWVGLTNQVALVGIWSFPVFLVWALGAMFVFNEPRAARVEKADP